VRDKNFSSCLISCPRVCHILEIVLQSNDEQLKLSYHMLYFLAGQTHVEIFRFTLQSMSKKKGSL